jgi:integrase/recombinase XerD
MNNEDNSLQLSNSNNLQKPENIENILSTFLLSQDVKQSSRNLYGRILRLFFKWVNSKGYQLSELSRIEIIKYKEEALAEGRSSLTVGSYLTAIRKFYQWLEANKIYPNIASGVKTPKRVQEFKKLALTTEQCKSLLAYLEAKKKRDYAIVSLLLRTGLRTIEVKRALIEDITFKSGKRILLVQGKGRDEKDNFVILTDKAYRPIQEYLKTRGQTKNKAPLFTSTSNNSVGDSLSTRTISKIVKDALVSIGIDNKHITAHSLRHTTAVNILREGGSLTDAQGVLRHSSPNTTQIYTKTIEGELRIKNAPEELIDNVY